jgi:murein DD-endopeptidase MepM/ murein hydrolase activator NlpD
MKTFLLVSSATLILSAANSMATLSKPLTINLPPHYPLRHHNVADTKFTELKNQERASNNDLTQIRADAVADLRGKKLILPIYGTNSERLKGSFYEMRGKSRHEAVDILAPRNTPVLSVEKGKIARLFLSKAGGKTIYQFDPSEKYTYYYAHLENYAQDLHEGDQVRKGQILGYVGTSGNAPANTPHLHFSISILGKDRRWWEGLAIDPYEVFKANKYL